MRRERTSEVILRNLSKLKAAHKRYAIPPEIRLLSIKQTLDLWLSKTVSRLQRELKWQPTQNQMAKTH